jgi:hypothetical protein
VELLSDSVEPNFGFPVRGFHIRSGEFLGPDVVFLGVFWVFLVIKREKKTHK